MRDYFRLVFDRLSRFPWEDYREQFVARAPFLLLRAAAEAHQDVRAFPHLERPLPTVARVLEPEERIAEAYEDAGRTMACNMMEPAALEGVQAFIEKRKPDWPA